jgi:DNA-binding CsgD family transcriptional regulator
MSDRTAASSHAPSLPNGATTLDASRSEVPGLVGRAPEREAPDGLLDAARQGRSGCPVVRGEGGMGKTALLTSGANALICRVAMTLGLLELGRGRPGQALDRLLVVISTVRPESNPLFVLRLPDAVEAAARTERLSEVAPHLDRFEAWVRAFPNRVRLGVLARCRALIDDAPAEQHFLQAVELGDALSPFDRAWSELLYGEWLRRHRRRVDARPHLRAVIETFQQFAVAPWEERARSELRASGETARKRGPATRDQLTPQELPIARLVADGMSNPDVAAWLFLSPRTIDYHLRKVFSKLEISSPAELAGLIGQ